MPAVRPSRRSVHLCRALGIGVAALMLAGCGGGEDAPDAPGAPGASAPAAPITPTPVASPPGLGAIPVLSDTARLTFPLDAYDHRPSDQALLERAQDELAVRCMARYGFDYVPPERTAHTTRPLNARVFGVVDKEEAARYGYGDPGAAGDRRAPVGAELSEEGRLTLYGERVPPAAMPMSQEEAEREGGSSRKVGGKAVPVGGCNRESYLRLYAPTADSVDIMFVFNLKAQSKAQSEADTRVRRNDAAWAACMRTAGYDKAADPMKAVQQLGLQDAPSGPAAIAAAQADVACKKKVNLVGVRYTVQSAYQKRLVAQHAETLELARKQQADRLKRAAGLTR
ncbi:hypothetical protein ACIQ6Y_13000 [Streptomyces sp. NPDC096205]|uniref:hypothetical protein n=1 Tax=Streptomyces sp. NPDC096205 TaxID=3366081 RepID=UPI0038027A0B